jgi:hypothetical protein
VPYDLFAFFEQSANVIQAFEIVGDPGSYANLGPYQALACPADLKCRFTRKGQFLKLSNQAVEPRLQPRQVRHKAVPDRIVSAKIHGHQLSTSGQRLDEWQHEHLSLYGRITSEIERREQRQVVRAMTIDSISHSQTSVDGNGFYKVLSWT